MKGEMERGKEGEREKEGGRGWKGWRGRERGREEGGTQ